MSEDQNNSASSDEIDYELIRQVADQVYKMLLQEARTDYERRRISRHLQRYTGG
jgi:hypothetical protein